MKVIGCAPVMFLGVIVVHPGGPFLCIMEHKALEQWRSAGGTLSALRTPIYMN
jgi:hypothetical protein